MFLVMPREDALSNVVRDSALRCLQVVHVISRPFIVNLIESNGAVITISDICFWDMIGDMLVAIFLLFARIQLTRSAL